MSIGDMRDHIKADSLGFLSYEGMIKAIGLPEDKLCTACFSGEYPIDLLERSTEVKRVEQPQPLVTTDEAEVTV